MDLVTETLGGLVYIAEVLEDDASPCCIIIASWIFKLGQLGI